MSHFLHCKTSQELVLDKNLLYSGICAELEARLELISALDLNVQLVIRTEALNHFKLVVIAIDKDEILWFSLDQELLKRVSVHSCFQWKVARAALNLHFNKLVLALASEYL